MINIIARTLKRLGKVAIKKPVQIMALFISLVLYSASGYMNYELPNNPNLEWSDAFWWSIVTMTTVGYGDLFPVTFWGRIMVGFPTMLLGVGILGYVLSLATSTMLELRTMEKKGMKTITITDHIIICNYVSADKTLKLIQEIEKDNNVTNSNIVIVDDNIDELPSQISSDTVHFVKGNPSHDDILKKANIKNCSSVIIQALTGNPEHSDNANLRVGLMIETINPDVYTVVECIDPKNEIFFRRANCDSVVCLAALSGQILVHEMQDPGVSSIVAELTSNDCGKQFYLSDFNLKDNQNYSDLKNHFLGENSFALGIRRENKNLLLPPSNTPLMEGDRAIIIADQRPA
ncbi:MAG: potassium channel family protein [Verrucomicrobiales bacterium]